MTPMTVAMMMFTALSLIESASMPASFNLRTADAIQTEAVGPPDACGDSIEGRVHHV